MKKRFTKIITLVLSAICLATCVLTVGCSNKDDGKTVYAYVLAKGYGDEWFTAMANAFEEQDWVQEKYPGIKIEMDSNGVNGMYYTEITKGEKSKYDMMFGNYTVDTASDSSNVDLTEIVYNQLVPGEDVKYIDKLQEGVADFESYIDVNGNVKFGSVATINGSYGILYNQTRLELLGEKVPNTTDEWFAIMDRVKNRTPDDKYGYNYSIMNATNGYSFETWYIWWMQYQGKEGYEDFYNGIYNGRISENVLKQEGRLKSLEIMEKCFKKTNGYYYPAANTLEDAITAQQYLSQGKGLFHFNGDYFANEAHDYESELGSSDVIGMMKTPIVSAIIEKTATINSDSQLSAVIDEIDAGKSWEESNAKTQGVSEADYAKIQEARGAIYSSLLATGGMICSWSDKIDVCADFLRFTASDIAIEAVLKNSDFVPAFKSNIKTENPELFNSLGLIQRTLFDTFNGEPTLIKNASAFTLGKVGLSSLKSLESTNDAQFERIFGRASNPLTAQQVLDNDYNYWTENNKANWNKLLVSAGLPIS